jgi:ATP-dependent Clp protease ATP-binding subunit ClpA
MAWQLAAREAMRTRHPYIEKEDIFIGLCQLGICLRAMKQRGKLRSHTAKDVRALCAEAEMVEETLRTLALSPTILGNTVRAAAERSTTRHMKKNIHRSQACKMYFQRAEALAVAAQAAEVHCMHLLVALLAQPEVILTGAVAIFGVDIKALHARAVAITAAIDARKGHVEDKVQGVSHIIYVGTDFDT